MKNIKFEFQAIGTSWVIDIADDVQNEAEILEKINQRIAQFDKDYSRFREDSLVTHMSQEAGSFTLPHDADQMIALYKKMYEVTDGAVTPLIGKVLVDAGYDANYSLKTGTLSTPKPWSEVINWENPTLTLSEPAHLDFGAGGKGYLVDIVSKILEENGIDSYCVDAGGDMRYRNIGNVALRVGLEHPDDATQVIGIAELKNRSLCGSAGNRRAWGEFHHIISPHTLSSPHEILALWTIADTTLLSDLVATGLFFTSAEVLLKHFQFDYLILRPDYTVEKSDGFDVELFMGADSK